MKEPVNTYTHLFGFFLGIVGLILLLVKSAGDLSKMVTMTIFGCSILVLYACSSLYHWINTTQQKEMLLRKLDHIAIYLLIAGSYTPVFYYGLTGWWKAAMLIAVWLVAAIGILLKVFFMKVPRGVSTAFYLLIGWIAVIPFARLVNGLPPGALALIIAGGLAYTVGAVIYGTKRISLCTNKFGFHEIFHVFVLMGTTLHFLMVFFYILPM